MKTLTLLVVLASVLFVAACSDDPTSPPPPPCGGAPCPEILERRDLSQRWHVLNNIEYAYANRSTGPTVYEEFLNEDFVFYFSPGDVGGGTPEHWARPDEMAAVTALFLSNEGNTTGPVCRSMRFDLQFDRDTLTWVEFQPQAFPSETWYSTAVFYTFTFEIEPDMTYIAVQAAKAHFTVRNNPQNGKDHWELVELRDLGSSPRQSSTVSVKEATWGAIKALY